MRDYILFLFRNETDESIIEKLSKLNVESVFVNSNISKFISLFDPLALIVDDFTLFSKEKIKTNLPIIYIYLMKRIYMMMLRKMIFLF